MGKFEKELSERLLRHEPIEKTREWFLERLVFDYGKFKFSELTKLEQMFAKDIFDAYAEWKKLQTPPKLQ